jgi:hypothetical protein
MRQRFFDSSADQPSCPEEKMSRPAKGYLQTRDSKRVAADFSSTHRSYPDESTRITSPSSNRLSGTVLSPRETESTRPRGVSKRAMPIELRSTSRRLIGPTRMSRQENQEPGLKPLVAGKLAIAPEVVRAAVNARVCKTRKGDAIQDSVLRVRARVRLATAMQSMRMLRFTSDPARRGKSTAPLTNQCGHDFRWLAISRRIVLCTTRRESAANGDRRASHRRRAGCVRCGTTRVAGRGPCAAGHG